MRARNYSLLLLLFAACVSLPSFAENKRKVDSLEKVLLRAADDTNKVNLLLEIAKEYNRGNPDKSLDYSKQAMELSEKLNYKDGVGRTFLRMGYSYFVKFNYPDAVKYYTLSAGVMRELKDTLKVASAYNNIARVYEAQGLYEKALENYLTCLKLTESTKAKTGLDLVLLNLGNLYLNESDREKAFSNYQKCLEIAAAIKDSLVQSSAMNNLSIIYRKQGKFDEALRCQQEASVIKEKIGDERGLLNGMVNTGLIYLGKKEYKKALEAFHEACARNEKLGSKFETSMVLDDIGLTYVEVGDYAKAIEYFEKALKLAQQIGANEVVRDACLHLAQACRRAGKLTEAYDYFEKYAVLKDSLLNQENQKNITQMQALYESEKKDKEIKLLNKDNEVQSAELHKRTLMLWAGGAVLLLLVLMSFFIYRSYMQKKKANSLLERKTLEISRQKSIIEEKNKEIIDSINYAQRIQTAILPARGEMEELLPGSFVLFRPKDIVSGDFYWTTRLNGYTFYTAADCTGHGVPGGFMSMLGMSLLNEIVNEKKITDPADILDMMRIKIIMSLKQKGHTGENKDGMDMVLCRLNESRTEMVYAAANNPLWVVRHDELVEFPASKQPVGISTEHASQFVQHTVPLQKNDVIYIFTDGYADQFGLSAEARAKAEAIIKNPGSTMEEINFAKASLIKGKKFKYTQLKEKLTGISSKPMEEQEKILALAFEQWKGGLEQVDDVCIIGVRV